MPAVTRIPRYDGPDLQLRAYSDELVRVLETLFQQLVAPSGTYVVSNPVTSRSLNVSTATLAQATAVLGTVIQDLRNKGVFN